MFEFFSSQMDYIFFFYGLSFILLAALCFSLYQNRADPVPWIWLFLFGLTHGVNEWLDMLAISLGDSPAFSMVRLVLMTISFVCLFEFGRAGITALGGRYGPFWLYIPLIFITGLGAIWGIPGLNPAIRYAFGFTGALFAALLFLRDRKLRHPDSRPLLFAAMGMGIYAVATGIVVPYAPFFPASVINAAAFLKLTGIPIQLIRGICAVVIAVAIWLHYCDLFVIRYAKVEKERFKRWATIMIVLLFIVVICGWAVTDMRANGQDSLERANLAESSRIIAAGLNFADVALPGNSTVLPGAAHARVKQHLENVQASSSELHWIYLMGQKNGSIVFLVDSTNITDPAYAPPGSVYTDAPPGLTAVFSTGSTVTLGPYTDQWGSFISSFTPVRDPVTREVTAVLGIDVDANLWKSMIAGERLETIIVMIFITLLLITFFLSQLRIRESTITLSESEEKYRTLFDSAGDVIFIHDLSGKIVAFNTLASERYGYTPPQLMSMTVRQVDSPENASQAMERIARLIDLGHMSFETVHIRKDGSLIPTAVSARLISWDGQPAVMSICHDITERKTVEEKVLVLSDRLSLAARAGGVGIWDFDVVNNTLIWDDQMFALYGITREQFSGAYDAWQAGLHPDDRLQGDVEIQMALNGEKEFNTEFRVLWPDGRIHTIRALAIVQRDSIGKPLRMIGTNWDITEQKTAEEELRRSEEKFRLLIENSHDIIYTITPTGIFTFVSPSWTAHLGHPVNEVEGRPFQQFVHPDDLPACMAFLQKTIETGQRQTGIEYRVRHADGTWRYHTSNAVPLKDKSGIVIAFEGSASDITERKKADEALLQASKKLAMLNSITRHDILNQLMGLRTYLELSKEDVKDPVFLNYIQKEDQAAEAIQWQIEFTKNYQDIGGQMPKWQNLLDTISSAVSQLKPPGVEINVAVDRAEVFADPLMEKVFYNLMENSLRHGEHVTLMDFSVKESENGLILTYADNGVGVTAEDKKKLFVKGFGKHTGLGLFLSKEILSITGITIRETGEPGKGARFEMAVPKGAYRIADVQKEL